MGKLYQGKGKLYDGDDFKFMSDARYQITAQHDGEDRQVNSGTLFGIEYPLLIDIQDKDCVLHLEDGTRVDIHTKGLELPPGPNQLDFYVHSEL
ncbi:unnamed protein product [marine sediment metagenome]|uniref:Uncharacterized protein n=1 Tax=marine sediment metagenome TaxID=412755 RepID=X0Z7P1_9ZZZZ